MILLINIRQKQTIINIYINVEKMFKDCLIRQLKERL